jgi:hypothetical protein
MINFLKGLPLNVLAVEATGQVTHEDYRDRLIPKAEAMLGHGPIRMLYVIGPEFTGFDIGAIVDDGIFGMRHSHDFVRIAVVTDLAWPKTASRVPRVQFGCAGFCKGLDCGRIENGLTLYPLNVA